jgi:hypothetical protein
MAANPLPLILLAGGAALLLGSKKKSGSSVRRIEPDEYVLTINFPKYLPEDMKSLGNRIFSEIAGSVCHFANSAKKGAVLIMAVTSEEDAKVVRKQILGVDPSQLSPEKSSEWKDRGFSVLNLNGHMPVINDIPIEAGNVLIFSYAKLDRVELMNICPMRGLSDFMEAREAGAITIFDLNVQAGVESTAELLLAIDKKG